IAVISFFAYPPTPSWVTVLWSALESHQRSISRRFRQLRFGYDIKNGAGALTPDPK
ncbi:hypothetical protein TNIN_443061, partial [Trichonephila inaurata madagascariensis]